MMRDHRACRGVTLIELLVTLSILATLSAVSTLAIRRMDQPNPEDPRTILADSIRVALATGRSAHVHLVIGGVPTNATALPDGRVVGDSTLAFEQLTGLPARAKP
jgi:prepilin-type N-terminal cleavage/methylation domain-containing protein